MRKYNGGSLRQGVKQLRRILLCVIPGAFTIVIALQLFGGVFFATRPGSWDSIRLGMSREEVITVLGTPTVNTVELKGQDSWRRLALLNERTFVVRYDMSRTVEDVLERNYRRRWSSE